MTSFALHIEPARTPRLAAAALLVHIAAAASPWFTRAATPLAAALSLMAIAALAWSLQRIAGRHTTLAACAFDARGWRIRLRNPPGWLPAELAATSRAYPSLALLELCAGGRRFGWLLPRAALPAHQFRRLKARIRLSC